MNIRNFENHHPYISLPLSHIIKCKRTTLKLFFFWRKWKYQHLQPNPTQWKFTVKLTNNPNTSPNRGYITWPLKLRTPRLNPTQHAQCRTQSSGLTNTDTKISPLLLDPPPPDHPKIYLWVQISHPSLSLSLSSEDCLLSSAGDSCRQSAARNLQPRSICLCLCLSIWTIGGLCTYSGCMILWEGKEVPVI